MPEDKTTEEKAATPAAAETTKENDAPSHDPVKTELDRENRRSGQKTELEKALFTREQLEKRIAELQSEAGVPAPIAADDTTPVTVGMLRKLDAEKAQKTALELAENIPDANERELTKKYLRERVLPTGNAEEDLRFARAAVNSIKNGMIAAEAMRKPEGSAPTSSGAPARPTEGEFIPTMEESVYMSAPFNLTKDQIVAARKAAEAARQ